MYISSYKAFIPYIQIDYGCQSYSENWQYVGHFKVKVYVYLSLIVETVNKLSLNDKMYLKVERKPFIY